METAQSETRRHGENSLTRPCQRKRCRGPFGFAQGKLFDSAGTSLRQVPLRSRWQHGWGGWCLRTENWPAPPATYLYVIPCMDGLTGVP